MPGVNVHERKGESGWMESLLRQSHHHDRVLATGKEQHGLFKLSRDLTHDEDRFSFQ